VFILINKQAALKYVKSVGVFGNANMAPTLGTQQGAIIHSYTKIRGNRKKKEGLGGRGSGDINLPRDTKCVKYFSLCIVTATGEMETKKRVR
jgi:hypothetical protein